MTMQWVRADLPSVLFSRVHVCLLSVGSCSVSVCPAVRIVYTVAYAVGTATMALSSSCCSTERYCCSV